jgi:predicted permease
VGETMTIWDFFSWFIWFYIAVSCVFLFFTLFIDVFRDDTLNGWAKALWAIVFVCLPFVGAILYLIVRGRSMSARRARDQEYIRDADGAIRAV